MKKILKKYGAILLLFVSACKLDGDLVNPNEVSLAGGDPNLPKTNEQKMGDPNAKPPQPPTPQVKPVLPKPPEPKAVEPPVKPAVTKPKDQLDLKPAVRKSNTKPETANIKPTKSTAKETAKSKADADARAAGAKLAQQIAKAKEGLQRGFSQGTAINVWGEGGPAYADYAQTVKSIYDDAWIVLPDISLDAGMAVVKVTVARDGRVVRATIIDRSGQRALDLSVQQALDRVTRLPSFPAEAKDDQRTFTIEFDLKAKRSAA